MKKYILTLFLFVCCTAGLYAQTGNDQQVIEVSGVVTDANKEPLIGVNVTIKDHPGLGTITDINGKFKIKMEPYLLGTNLIGAKWEVIEICPSTVSGYLMMNPNARVVATSSIVRTIA